MTSLKAGVLAADASTVDDAIFSDVTTATSTHFVYPIRLPAVHFQHIAYTIIPHLPYLDQSAAAIRRTRRRIFDRRKSAAEKCGEPNFPLVLSGEYRPAKKWREENLQPILHSSTRSQRFIKLFVRLTACNITNIYSIVHHNTMSY